MKTIFVLSLLLAGCGELVAPVEVSDTELAENKAHVAIAAATLAMPSPDKPLRKDCTVCNGTGKVRSGDGLYVFDCTNCVAPAQPAEPAVTCPCPQGGPCTCNCAGDCDCPGCTCKPAKPVGRTVRLLYFGLGENCPQCVRFEQAELPHLLAAGYTFGDGSESVIQRMPASAWEEYGVSEAPTFLRLEHGKVTHRMVGRVDWRSVVNAVHGKQMFPEFRLPPQSPPVQRGWQMFYRLPEQRSLFYGAGMVSGAACAT